MQIKYKTTMWAEQKPDIYHGENCDEVRPRFECHSDGDMESEFLDAFELRAVHFPPGTKVLVQLPCCPQCGQDVEMCITDDYCGFDWDTWTENRYQ